MSIPSPFWKSVLLCWLKHADSNSSPLSLEDPLFNNKNIKLNGKMLFSPVCLKKGIISVKDMFYNNVLINFEGFYEKTEHHPNAMIDYHIICSALRLTDLSNYQPDHSFYFKGATAGKIGRKRFYLLIKPFSVPISCGFWKRKYNIDIASQNWLLVHQLKEAKLAALSWKIMHNIYPTNTTLFKMKLTNSTNCGHCDGNKLDTIEHFFYECSKIQEIWREVKLDILRFMDIRVNLNDCIILLGAHYIQELDHSQLLQTNRVIAIATHSISKYKLCPNRSIIDVYESEALVRQLWDKY